MCVAVKADAYGHGAVPVAKCLEQWGTDCFAVATVPEGIELREAGITKPILILSMTNPSEFDDLIKYSITPFVGDAEYISLLDEAGVKAGVKDFQVHLAVDSGMGRVGCLPEAAPELAKLIASSRSLKLGGMSTHFATADGTSVKDMEYAEAQYKAFTGAVEAVRKEGIDPGTVHCANSAACIAHPDWQLDMVRPGIIVYGYYADQITKEYLAERGISLDLKPVMALVSGISVIRPFEKGKSVSYGSTWTSESPTDIAVLPAGYADGLLRRYADTLKVTVNGKLYPVRGRICMDQCMIDLGKDNPDVKRWDRAVIFGPEESGALLDAESLAKDRTISYEVLTSITKRVERVYID